MHRMGCPSEANPVFSPMFPVINEIGEQDAGEDGEKTA